jgi:cardiolipin synthase (CMP-forming)
MTVPNALTGVRIALVPVFGWLWLHGHQAAALWVFAIGGATDLLDGLLARALDQKSRLGALLDPAADKLTLLVAFLVGASVGAVPWWLAALVIGRDLVLSIGAALFAFVVHGRHDPGSWQPSRLGKYSTFYQLATIGLALVTRASDEPGLGPWVAALALISAALTTISGFQYISTGIFALKRPLKGATTP